MRKALLALLTAAMTLGIGAPVRDAFGQTPWVKKGAPRIFNALQLRCYASGSEPTSPPPEKGALICDTTDGSLRVYDGASWGVVGGGGGAGFDAITTGTNTTATMTCGTGCSVATSGTGSIVASTLSSTGADTSADFAITQNAATSGTPNAPLRLTGAAHTTLAASTEATDVLFALDRTVEFTTGGTIANQRAVRITAPTYSATSATQTITEASTLAIVGAPVAGTNVAITNAYALWVQSGRAQFEDVVNIEAGTQTGLSIGNGDANVWTLGRDSSTGNLVLKAIQSSVAFHIAFRPLIISSESSGGRLAFDSAGGGLGRFVRNGSSGALSITTQDSPASSTAHLEMLLSHGGNKFLVRNSSTGTLTASTEFPSVDFDLDTTKTWATGAITTQREMIVRAPTYAFAGTSTITTAATLAITDAPIAGTNAIITDRVALLIEAGGISSRGAGTGSEVFGMNAAAAGTNGTAVGHDSSAGTSGSVAVGYQSSAGGSSSVAIGWAASAAGGNSVSIGINSDATTVSSAAYGGWAQATNTNTVSLGYLSAASGHSSVTVGKSAAASGTGAIGIGTSSAATGGNYSIALGFETTTTAANQLVVGGTTGFISEVYVGAGVTSATPQALALNATGGSGTDIASGDFTIAGGRSTGNADAGDLLFQVSDDTAGSGTTLQTLVTKLTISPEAANFSTRIGGAKGADVASATNVTLGTDGNYFDITGTTTVACIVSTDWQAGSVVILQFDASLTVNHNDGGCAGANAAILLSGAGNFSATADDTLTLVYDGTTWRETARTVI